jgi:hypothetical protein
MPTQVGHMTMPTQVGHMLKGLPGYSHARKTHLMTHLPDHAPHTCPTSTHVDANMTLTTHHTCHHKLQTGRATRRATRLARPPTTLATLNTACLQATRRHSSGCTRPERVDTSHMRVDTWACFTYSWMQIGSWQPSCIQWMQQQQQQAPALPPTSSSEALTNKGCLGGNAQQPH